MFFIILIIIFKRQVLFVSSAKSVVDKGGEDFFDINLNVSITVAHSFDDLVRQQLLGPEWAEHLLSWRPTGVTLFLLWGEYKSRCLEGFSIAGFVSFTVGGLGVRAFYVSGA